MRQVVERFMRVHTREAASHCLQMPPQVLPVKQRILHIPLLLNRLNVLLIQFYDC